MKGHRGHDVKQLCVKRRSLWDKKKCCSATLISLAHNPGGSDNAKQSRKKSNPMTQLKRDLWMCLFMHCSDMWLTSLSELSLMVRQCCNLLQLWETVWVCSWTRHNGQQACANSEWVPWCNGCFHGHKILKQCFRSTVVHVELLTCLLWDSQNWWAIPFQMPSQWSSKDALRVWTEVCNLQWQFGKAGYKLTALTLSGLSNGSGASALWLWRTGHVDGNQFDCKW